jgi:hypothetical protein
VDGPDPVVVGGEPDGVGGGRPRQQPEAAMGLVGDRHGVLAVTRRCQIDDRWSEVRTRDSQKSILDEVNY